MYLQTFYQHHILAKTCLWQNGCWQNDIAHSALIWPGSALVQVPVLWICGFHGISSLAVSSTVRLNAKYFKNSTRKGVDIPIMIINLKSFFHIVVIILLAVVVHGKNAPRNGVFFPGNWYPFPKIGPEISTLHKGMNARHGENLFILVKSHGRTLFTSKDFGMMEALFAVYRLLRTRLGGHISSPFSELNYPGRLNKS